MSADNIRVLAARTLAPVIAKGQSLTPLFDAAIEKVSERDKGLFQTLCFGTLRQYHQLSAITERLLDKPLRNKDTDIQALVLLGLYQLIHLRTPDHAAISETVSACKPLRKLWAGKLVNGLLRNFLRNRDEIEAQLQNSDAYQYSHPAWFIGKLKKAWPNTYIQTLHANNQQPPVCLRVNQQQCTREKYVNLLENAGISFDLLETAPNGVRLQTQVDVRTLPGFDDGWFSVQDEAAQLSAELLDLKPGQRVLDACAAPGGKSCHILEKEAKIRELVCIEQESSRMERVEQNLLRLQLRQNVTLKVSDANDLNNWWDGQVFDRILLDAPCSATGVIRRHPDIKLLRRPDDLAKLGALQLQLLAQLWQVLAPGGLLVYATCSVLPEENERIVQAFLQQTANAEHLAIEAPWGVARPIGRQLFPQLNGHDGFYYARLYKEACA